MFLGEFLVEVEQLRVHRQRGDEQIVGLGHGARQRMPEDVADLEFFVIFAGRTFHHLLPHFPVSVCAAAARIARAVSTCALSICSPPTMIEPSPAACARSYSAIIARYCARDRKSTRLNSSH